MGEYKSAPCKGKNIFFIHSKAPRRLRNLLDQVTVRNCYLFPLILKVLSPRNSTTFFYRLPIFDIFTGLKIFLLKRYWWDFLEKLHLGRGVKLRMFLYLVILH